MNSSNQPIPTGAIPIGIKYDASKGEYTVDYVKTIKGKRVHVYASHLSSLEQAIDTKNALMEEKMKEFRKRELVHMTFATFFEQYCAYRSLHVRSSSLKQAKTVVHRYLGAWSSEPASIVLSASSLKCAYDEIVGNDAISANWKNKIIGVLRSFTKTAFKWRIIDAETFQDDSGILENIIDPSRKKEYVVWSQAEEARFLEAIEDPAHRVMFTLFMELGARISEFLGLTWDAYDPKRGVLSICRQLLNDSQKTYVLSDCLKTKESYRTCKLSKLCQGMLGEYKKSCPSTHFIFYSPADPNRPFSKMVFRHLLETYIKKAKVRRITPHGFRHAKATKLLKACRNMLEVKAIARYLGHSASILMDVYSHSQEETLEAVLRRINR